MRTLYFAPFLLLLAGPAAAQTDDEFRKGFLQAFSTGCLAEQRKLAAMSEDAIKRYCACYTDQLPGTVTVPEMRQVGATGALSPALQSRLTAIGKSCMDRLKP